jgi:3',5'-cyclic AMP phosphodiesterase CpdA
MSKEEHNVSMQTRKTRIVCISDTHNQTPKLPPGDVLIHAGDLTNQGSYSELKKTVEWLEKADFEAKIIVAGRLTSHGRRSLLKFSRQS